MFLTKTSDLLSLPIGETISKRNLADLIQFSKVSDSPFWSGVEAAIGNTPQQGINWVGQPPGVSAVIVKVWKGSYEEDGWSDKTRTSYHYSFKAKNGTISYRETANAVLVNQPERFYPVLLFTENGDDWSFEGEFCVGAIEDTFVVLNRGGAVVGPPAEVGHPKSYREGDRKYVTHLMAERSRAVVKLLKDTHDWVCDICGQVSSAKYGVNFIDAHHKTPISTYSASHEVGMADLALLCPNCHRAVHVYMKDEGLEYSSIRSMLGQGHT